MIRAAIFDLDGVLLDSMSIWKDLGVRYILGQGLQPIGGMSETLFAMSMEQGAAWLKEHFALPQSEAEIIKDMEAMLQQYYYDEVQAKPGAKLLLDELMRGGIRMAAATSSPRSHVTRALERNGLLSYMEAIFTTGEIGESKHSPLIYNTAAKLLDAKPEETLVFEDSLYALETAKKAGYRTVGVYDADGESRQDVLKETADVYCTDFGQLLSLWTERKDCFSDILKSR